MDTANTQHIIDRLNADAADVSILVLSDSTGNDDTEWPYLTAQHLAASFPAYTVEYRLWDRYTQTYSAPRTLGTGTGPHVLRFWNGATPGRSTRYHLGGLYWSMVTPTKPQHVFIAHGHNEGANANSGIVTDDGMRWRGQMLALTETIAARWQDVQITLVLENPQTSGTNSERRVAEYRDIAETRGYGLIDVYSVFLANPTWVDDWMTDATHPNAVGERAWADEVIRFLDPASTDPASPRTPSPLASAAPQIFSNPLFDSWIAATPQGWAAASGAVAVKDTGTRESGPWSMRLHGPGNARVSRPLPAWVVNRWVTVTARIFIPAGEGIPATGARIGLGGRDGTVISRDDSREGYGGWMWITISNYQGSAAGVVYLYADGLDGGAGVIFDRVSVVVGDLPRAC